MVLVWPYPCLLGAEEEYADGAIVGPQEVIKLLVGFLSRVARVELADPMVEGASGLTELVRKCESYARPAVVVRGEIESGRLDLLDDVFYCFDRRLLWLDAGS